MDFPMRQVCTVDSAQRDPRTWTEHGKDVCRVGTCKQHLIVLWSIQTAGLDQATLNLHLPTLWE